MTGVALGFIPEPLTVPIASILPSRRTPAGMIASRKFKQIRSSIEEVGLIEPLSVTPVDQASGNHVLLDGHLRLIAMQDLQFSAAACLVATDDESYTYNNRVNRLSTSRNSSKSKSSRRQSRLTSERLAQITNPDPGLDLSAAGRFARARLASASSIGSRSMHATYRIPCRASSRSKNSATRRCASEPTCSFSPRATSRNSYPPKRYTS